MASIPLRTYNREIETMVDTGQVDEAAAHCLQILKTIPKHLATYRLLGKALLENQRFSDAADVFQRVLSSMPDDFIANLGMSIIREDEGNIDSAIWHMERAYENQPANAAIQDELRRLYGKRDSIEPPKVRLTRGALARMYARGHLYVQAVAELRAALSEDPLRPDLQVLLAEMYYLAGQRVESVDVCSALLNKFPYCAKANLLLAIILPGTERAQDADVYRQRMVSLDPYFIKAKPTALSSDEVPDNAINIERLDIKPGQFTSSTPTAQPSWATSLGIAFSDSSAGALPEWLEGAEGSALAMTGEAGATSVPPFEGLDTEAFTWAESEVTGAPVWPESVTKEDAALPGLPAESPAAEDAIPEWMKEAGWEEATGEGQEAAFPFEETDATLAQEGGEIEKGDIPDWLRGMAPSGILEEENLEDVEIDTNLLPWLAAVGAVAGLHEEEKPAEADQIEDLEGVALSEEAEEVAGWLKEIEPEAATAPAIEPESPLDRMGAEVEAEELTPDWLKETSPEEEVSLEELFTISAPEEAAPAAEERPSWLSEAPAETEEKPAEPGELPDWLKEIEPAITTAAAAETAEETPDWLRQEEEEKGSPVETAAEALAAAGLAAAAVEQITDRRREEEEKEAAGAGDVEPLVEAEAQAPMETAAAGAVLAGMAAETAEEKPDWLRQIEAEEEAAQVGIQAEAPPSEAEPAEAAVELAVETSAETEVPAMPDLNDPEAAMAWLESLAAKQGVPEEQLALTHTPLPEMKVEAEVEAEAETEAEAGLAAETAEEKPEWLRQIESEAETAEMEIPTGVGTPAAAEVEAPMEAALTEEKPEWLRELEAEEEEPGQAPVLKAVEAGLIASVAAGTQPEAQEEFGEIEETDAAMAWLEGLAARQGASQDQLTTRPEDRVEEVPEWVLEQTQAAEETAVPSVEEVPPEQEIPGWIQTEPTLEAEAPVEAVETQPEMIVEETVQETVEEEIPAWMRLEEEEEEVEWVPPEEAPAVAKLDLNQAPLAKLEELPGIGFVRAQNIVAYRETNGPFTSVDDLRNVSGIGPEIVNELRDLIMVTPPAEPKVIAKAEQPQPKDEDEARLFNGRGLLLEGKTTEAASQYAELIHDNLYIGEVIQDLQEFVSNHPVEIDLWQLLGDAFMRNDQLQDALDAYTHAEQLLR